MLDGTVNGQLVWQERLCWVVFTKQTHLHCVNLIFTIVGHSNISQRWPDGYNLADELFSTQLETLAV